MHNQQNIVEPNVFGDRTDSHAPGPQPDDVALQPGMLETPAGNVE
jgi:hypothetical protein